jgi:hypothetical protein
MLKHNIDKIHESIIDKKSHEESEVKIDRTKMTLAEARKQKQHELNNKPPPLKFRYLKKLILDSGCILNTMIIA